MTSIDQREDEESSLIPSQSPSHQVQEIRVTNISMPSPHETPSPVEMGDIILPDDGSLCPACYALCETFRQYQAQSKLLPNFKSGTRFLHQDIRDLKITVEKGCRLCCVFFRVLEEGQHGALWFQEYHAPLPPEGAVVLYHSWFKAMDDPSRIEISVEDHRSEIQRSLQFVPMPENVTKAIEKCEASSGNDTTTWSHSTVAMAHYWLEDCMWNHGVWCQNYGERNPHLPTRVIDVGECDSVIVRLHISAGQRDPYMALSHRWGSAMPLRLTQDSFDSMKEGIPFSALSPTFRDAVSITRSFGMQYLWIDSLCIIQDSAEDWKAESMKMSDIYRNAIVTLAATEADTEHGIILPRKAFLGRPVNMKIDVPEHTFGDQAGTLHCRIKQETDGDGNKYIERFFNDGPLDTRAWVLQERVLSSRVLSFTASELKWQCLENDYTESKPEGEKPSAEHESLSSPHSGTQHNDDPSEPSSDHDLEDQASSDEEDSYPRLQPKKEYYRKMSKTLDLKRRRTDYVLTFKKSITGLVDLQTDLSAAEELHFAWFLLVENYSRRNLTFDTDRLTALTGIVKELARATSNTFVAGLWKEYLWRDLLWRTSIYSHWLAEDGEICRRSKVLKMPSWSWVSVVGYIIYTTNEFDSFKDHTLLASSIEVKMIGDLDSQFHSLDVSGLLKVRGFLEMAVVENGNLMDPTSGNRIGTFDADVPLDGSLEISCLAISRHRHVHGGMSVNQSSVYCLGLIYAQDQPNTFTRVGLARWNVDDWDMRSMKQQDIIIA